ncbi:MAG: extracellular solute-binding protein [Chloroflexota bacterium]|nr:extracellular solute-binding protein [Chloroflexota bacterium]
MSDQLSRRRFLQRAAVSGAALAAANLLAACSSSSSTPTAAPAATVKPTTAAAATTAPAATAAPAATTAPAAATTSAPSGSASAGSATTVAPAAAATTAPVKVSGNVEYWSRETFDNGARQPLVQARLAAFDKANGTTSKVQFMIFAESVQKTQAALAAGAVPDLGEQGPDVTLGFAAAGNLLPIDDIFNSFKDQFLPLQKEAFVTYNGNAFSVPWYTETRVLFYHKDLLDKAGVKPPTTWQEWTAAAKALTKGEEQYGFAFNPEGPGPGQLFVPLASSAGGNLLDKDGKVNGNTPEFKASLQFLSDLYSSGSIPKAFPTYKQNDVDQLFALKKVAMYWTNGSILTTLKTTAPDALKTLGAVKTPPRDASGTSRSFLGGFQLFVFKQGKNTAAGKELLKYLFDPEWYADYVQKTNGGALPVTKAVAAKDTYQSDPILKTLVEQQQTAIRYGGPVYGNAPFLGEAEGKLLFSQPVIDVFTGKRSVDDALATMDTEVKKLAKQA